MPLAKPPVNWTMSQEMGACGVCRLNSVTILVAADSHTKWIEAVTMREATTEATPMVLHETFSLLGIPRTVVSDNRTQFISDTFAQFLAGNKVKHSYTALHHPQSNERSSRKGRMHHQGEHKASAQQSACMLSKAYLSLPEYSGKRTLSITAALGIHNSIASGYLPHASCATSFMYAGQ